LVVLGGSQSANDQTLWMQQEYRLIEGGLAARKPILGICLGAQMLARALGANVRQNLVPEIGWHPVYPTPAPQSDPVLSALDRSPLFHWHTETFDIPQGAERLCYSEGCTNQGYRYSNFAWGLQFHPEVTPGMIGTWLAEDAACAVPEVQHPIDP